MTKKAIKNNMRITEDLMKESKKVEAKTKWIPTDIVGEYAEVPVDYREAQND